MTNNYISDSGGRALLGLHIIESSQLLYNCCNIYKDNNYVKFAQHNIIYMNIIAVYDIV